ncbi:diguanylate cyclase [Candidatus Sororendozoicomonas aggregata]|uniref:diguanylate cyclase n=1 Tax=Candidatus Sororendozoicomonas aggregata TaxID=3073239 RepID=UPI002ED3568C
MWACFQGKGSKGVCYSGSVDTRRQTRHNQAQLASRKCLPLHPPGWRKTPAPVNGIVRLCQQSLRLLILLLICLAGLSSPAHASSIPVNVTGFSPISLTDHLLPINAPSALIAPDDPASKDTVQWFRFTLQNNDDLQKRWILAFREVPYTFLNVYTMTPTGFTLTELGVSNTQHHHGKDGTAIVLPPPRSTGTYYLAVESPYPNQFTPTLWPEGIHVLSQSKNWLLTALLMGVAVLVLFTALVKSIFTKTPRMLLPASHMVSLLLLLAFAHTRLFAQLPVAGDPGHWILVTAMITCLTALACYRQLADMPAHTPVISTLILGGCYISVSFLDSLLFLPAQAESLVTYGFFVMIITAILTYAGLLISSVKGNRHARISLLLFTLLSGTLATTTVLLSPLPRTIPTLLESAILVLHSICLYLAYWYADYKGSQQLVTLGVDVPAKKQRKIFAGALRKHLHKPDMVLSANDLTARILSTCEVALPTLRACMITHQTHQSAQQKDTYHVNATSSALTTHFEQQLPTLKSPIKHILAGQQDIHAQAHNGEVSWLFSIGHQDGNHEFLLLQAKTKHQDADWDTASDIASHARTLYQGYHQMQFWKTQARVDPLTGLLNRRAFTEEAKSYLCSLDPRGNKQSNQQHKQCSLLFIDIDNFKNINDTHGHTKGDEVLTAIAQLCRQNLRQEDLLCRLGGEEFAALLPHTPAQSAWHVAERLRKAIEQSPATIGITVSIGLAASSAIIYTLPQLIEAADTALYSAKKAGRNQIGLAQSCQHVTSS